MIKVTINDKILFIDNKMLLQDVFQTIKQVVRFNNSQLSNKDYMFYIENKSLSLDFILTIYNNANYGIVKNLFKMEVMGNAIEFKQM